MPVVGDLDLPPIDLRCEAGCFEKCPPLLPLEARADGTADPDKAGELLIEDQGAMDACDARRQQCADCIERGRKAGAVR